ncbi:hypothetical protein ACIOC1_00430 [Streptomyces sp. NPDC088197]|uniref:hypothetical protein n=1 Tax=Streptomyces sp. NPDC088197 TaxID=3365840 RepID=UPI0038005EC5
MATDLAGIRVDLGGISFNRVDDDGTWWVGENLEGWDGSDVRTQVGAREGDHGSWLGTVYLAERVLTLTGSIGAASPAALDDAVERLLAEVTLTDTTLTVWETVAKQVTVRRSGKPLVQRQGPVDADVSLLMTAGDPRRYAVDAQAGSTPLASTTGGLTVPYTVPYTLAAVTVSGQVDCLNSGSIETRPVLVIDGPVSQPTVLAQMPDGTVIPMIYSQDLGTGDRLLIDIGAKTVTLNGTVSRRRFLALPLGWPTIPPAAVVSFRFTAVTYNADALLTVRWRSAWI